MSLYVPLADWYPTLYEKWLREGRRIRVGTTNRTGYTIHHTAGGVAEHPLPYARWIASWHFSRWSRPGGYNFLIGTDGTVLEMCGWEHVGAHAPGCNRSRIGVAFQGHFEFMLPNAAQLAAFGRLASSGVVPNSQVGHRDCSPTGCPGARLYRALPLKTIPTQEDDVYVVKHGERGPRVVRAQKVLQAAAFRAGEGDLLPRFGADGGYGTETATAVDRMASRAGLSKDGKVGMDVLVLDYCRNWLSG